MVNNTLHTKFTENIAIFYKMYKRIFRETKVYLCKLLRLKHLFQVVLLEG